MRHTQDALVRMELKQDAKVSRLDEGLQNAFHAIQALTEKTAVRSEQRA